MSFDYLKTRETARKMLEKFGRGTGGVKRVTMTNVVPGTPGPGGGTTGGSATDTALDGVTLQFGAGQTIANGSLIAVGDKRILMEAKEGIIPSVEDLITTSEGVWVIKSVGEVNPAGTPVLYDLHVRK